MNTAYLLCAVRTPIGKFGGSLASQSVTDFGTIAAKPALERARVQPQQIEETIFGDARQAGGGANPARQISIRSAFRRKFLLSWRRPRCHRGLNSMREISKN